MLVAASLHANPWRQRGCVAEDGSGGFLLRQAWLLLAFVISVLAGWLTWRAVSSSASPPEPAQPVIDQRPVAFAERSFDPANPPTDMPPLGEGEEAECDSNFISDANLSGRMRKIDSSNATVTVAQVSVTLQLKITIWVPNGATQHVIEHEQGHRSISEHYYASADHLAAEIAASYSGRRIAVSGSDLDAEARNALAQLSKEITIEYNRRLNPDVAQQRFDDLTDHNRNDRDAKQAAAQAIQEAM
jgi:hypothetical protein